MGIRFSSQAARERDAATVERMTKLEKALPVLTELAAGLQYPTVVRGLSVSRGQGQGWLATLKLTCGPDETAPKDDALREGGDFVLYGYGEALLEALAALEEKLQGDVATLTPDKYSKDRGSDKTQRAPTRPRGGRGR